MTILTVDEKTLKVSDVSCTDQDLQIIFADGRKFSVPLSWYPRLANASREDRSKWELCGNGRGIHWPQIDEDLSIEGILRGDKAPDAPLV